MKKLSLRKQVADELYRTSPHRADRLILADKILKLIRKQLKVK
jgi:hypothetical protein